MHSRTDGFEDYEDEPNRDVHYLNYDADVSGASQYEHDASTSRLGNVFNLHDKNKVARKQGGGGLMLQL